MTDHDLCNQHSTALARLEQKESTTDTEVRVLRDTVHKISNTLTVQGALLSGVDKHITRMGVRLDKHMDMEELTIGKIYDRLKALDAELKLAFKERDKKIVDIEKAQIKYGVYMGVGVFILSLVVQVVMRAMF